MDAALVADSHEFVRLFIEHAVVDFEEYMNDMKLVYLYNRPGEVTVFYL